MQAIEKHFPMVLFITDTMQLFRISYFIGLNRAWKTLEFQLALCIGQANLKFGLSQAVKCLQKFTFLF